MKLRIKGNSVRIRLSVTEVQLLSSGMQLQEITRFGDSQLVYAVQPVDAENMHATFSNNKITLQVPSVYLQGWPSNSVVGFEELVNVGGGDTLHLLLEKDFKCLDVSEEDQSDFFENPAKSC